MSTKSVIYTHAGVDDADKITTRINDVLSSIVGVPVFDNELVKIDDPTIGNYRVTVELVTDVD